MTLAIVAHERKPTNARLAVDMLGG